MPADNPSNYKQEVQVLDFRIDGYAGVLHGYNLKQRYLQSALIVNEPLTANTFTQYFLSNGLLHFFIPIRFAISGYIYALQDAQPYRQRIIKRTRTLIVPYLFWSAMGLLITYILELSDYGRGIVLQTHPMQFTGVHTFLLIGYMAAKKAFDLTIPKLWLKPMQWDTIFILFAVVETILVFKEFVIMGNGIFQLLHIMYKLSCSAD